MLHRALPASLLPAALLLALTGCSLGPAYHRPDVPAPAAWRAAAPTGTATGTATAADNVTRESWPAADWWRGFRSPQLDELIARAERANDDIGAAVARVAEADAQARIAGAPLLPALSASTAVTRQRALTSAGTPALSTLHSAQLGASYSLDFWGRLRAGHTAARLAATASRYDAATVRLTVLTSVASTYFEVMELRERLDLAQRNLETAQKILHGLTLERSVGTATALDVAQQATSVANLGAAIPPLRRQLGQSIDALAILIGQPPESLDLAAGSLNALAAPPVEAGLPSELLARRPDVASAEAQLEAANANVAAARAAFFPSIDLTADGGFSSTALATLFQPASRLYAATAGLTQPIFQGGALAGQYAFGKARYRELLANYHKTVIAAFSNVEDALIAVQESREQLQRQEEAAASASHAFELSQAQFHAGTISVLTLLNTEAALFGAEDSLLQVKFLRLQSVIDLYSALGGGWERG